jgi:predicted nucleotidyltransferase
MMFGFAEERRRLLEAEVVRVSEELPRLGVRRVYVAGDLARGDVGLESDLALVIVQDSSEPFHRRADFFVDHLRPRAGTRYLVYTPEEFEALAEVDPVLIETLQLGEPIFAA